jgi:hypothetical protein
MRPAQNYIDVLTENGLTANLGSPHVERPERDFKSPIQNFLV